MNFWRWLSTPAEPRGQYMILTAIGTFVLMVATMPLWSGGSIVAVGIAGGLSGGISGAVAKLWMEREK